MQDKFCAKCGMRLRLDGNCPSSCSGPKVEISTSNIGSNMKKPCQHCNGTGFVADEKFDSPSAGPC